MAQAPQRMAYLLSVYPHIRHAYLLREIRGLRKLGFEIATLAIREDNRDAADCTVEELEERASCFYVLKAGWGPIFRAHARTFLANPGGWFAGLWRALGYGDFHPRRTLFALYYFAEAVVAGRWITDRGIWHVHTHYASTVAWIMARVFPLEVSMSIHGSGEFDEPRCFRLAEKIEASRFVRTISFFLAAVSFCALRPGSNGTKLRFAGWASIRRPSQRGPQRRRRLRLNCSVWVGWPHPDRFRSSCRPLLPFLRLRSGSWVTGRTAPVLNNLPSNWGLAIV